jgi:drug/metabolite transporter (DMT)-like permease
VSPFTQVIIASLLWGATGVFVREAGEMPPYALAFFRAFIPIFFLLSWLKLRPKKQKIFRENWKWMLMGSGLNTLRTLLFFTSFSLTSIANAQVTLYSWPIWAALFGFIFLKEKICRPQASLLAIAFFGLIIMFSQSSFNFHDKHFLGIAAMALSAIIHSFVVIIFKKYGTGYQSLEIVFFQNLLASIIFLPLVFPIIPSLTLNQIFISSLLGLCVGIIAFSLFFSAVKKIKTASAAQITYIEPLCGIMFGYFLYKEAINQYQIIGAVLILGSTFFLPFIKKKI